jgi:hypothetical protein
MRHQPLSTTIDDALLGDEADLGRDGAAGLERGFDAGFEITGHGWGMLDENLEDVVVR